MHVNMTKQHASELLFPPTFSPYFACCGVCVCLCHKQMFMKSATPDSGRPLSSQCANALLWLAVYAGISHLEVLHMFVSQLSEDTPVRLFVQPAHCHDATALFFACFTAQFGCESGMEVTLCRWDNGVGWRSDAERARVQKMVERKKACVVTDGLRGLILKNKPYKAVH